MAEKSTPWTGPLAGDFVLRKPLEVLGPEKTAALLGDLAATGMQIDRIAPAELTHDAKRVTYTDLRDYMHTTDNPRADAMAHMLAMGLWNAGIMIARAKGDTPPPAPTSIIKRQTASRFRYLTEGERALLSRIDFALSPAGGLVQDVAVDTQGLARLLSALVDYQHKKHKGLIPGLGLGSLQKLVAIANAKLPPNKHITLPF
ncbi:MAG TPA: hypothetical protein VLE73_02565 [Candidatus Saccharimonadales bacterium]|nr:hypothetical protein [Candidatus Saccharimonadales bacterium]